MRELQELDIAGAQEALKDRDKRIAQESHRRQARADALERRVNMLEGAVADATRADARARLVARFEAALAELEEARAAAAAPVGADLPVISPDVLARLDALREPEAAWQRMAQATRKQVIGALTTSAVIHPDADGYIIVLEWRGGGRTAAKVKTMRRWKIHPVPDDVLALFVDGSDSEPVRGVASRPKPAPLGTADRSVESCSGKAHDAAAVRSMASHPSKAHLDTVLALSAVDLRTGDGCVSATSRMRNPIGPGSGGLPRPSARCRGRDAGVALSPRRPP